MPTDKKLMFYCLRRYQGMEAAKNIQKTSHAWIQHEISLGQNLSKAMQSGRRADFGYLLSLLSTNALESGYARLQRDDSKDTQWHPPFACGPVQPMGANDQDWQRNPSRALHDSFTSWRLLNALQPEALSHVNDARALPDVVRENCAGFVRARWPEYGARSAEQESVSNEADLVDIIDGLRGTDRSAA